MSQQALAKEGTSAPSVSYEEYEQITLLTFTSALETMCLCEGMAKALLGEDRVTELLCRDPLTLQPLPPNFPASPDEAKSYITHAKDIGYRITPDHRFMDINEAAHRFVDFERFPDGKTLGGLNNHMANNLLPEKSEHRWPRSDFLTLQKMLSLLALHVTYQIPDVHVTFSRPHGGHYAAIVKARHAFERNGKFMGTICLVPLTSLDEAAYEACLQNDKIISPLPKELLEMVQNRTQHLQKMLQPAQEKARLRLLELEAERQAMSDDVPSIQTEEDLSRLLNLEAFKKAVADIPKTTEGMEILSKVDGFVTERVRAVVQDEVKGRLWPGEMIPGTVSFHVTPDHGSYYLRATILKRTKNIRPLTEEETEKHLARKAEKSSGGHSR